MRKEKLKNTIEMGIVFLKAERVYTGGSADE